MPPKKKEIRKEEEEIDLSTLPPWTSFTVFLHCHALLQRFFTPVQSRLAASTKPLLRADLVALAKERQLWIPANNQEPPPIDALAKAFKLRILLLDIAGRKAKKDLLTKIEDLEKRKADAAEKNLPPPTDVVEEPDQSLPDVLYLAYEFPSTVDEVRALAAEGCFVDLLLYLRPSEEVLVQINLQTRKDYADQCSAAQAAGQELPVESEMVTALTSLAQEFLAQATTSDRHSIMRELLIRQLKFSPAPAKLPTEAEEPEVDPYDADKEYLELAMDTVAESSRLYIEFQNWKKGTEIQPLFPYPRPVEPTSAAEVPAAEGEEGLAAVIAPPAPVDLRSLDDEPTQLDLRLYKKLFTSMPEGAAEERCFLVCMLQALKHKEGGSQIEQDEVTRLHSYFAKYWNNLQDAASDNGPLERQSIESASGGKPKVMDEADGVERIAKGVCFPNTTTEIGTLEHEVTRELVVPGIRRFQMPVIPGKSLSLREAERPVIYPFSSLPFEELERNLVLTEFCTFLEEREPGSIWSFWDRNYTEVLSQDMLTIALSDSLLHDPDVYTHYYSRDDSLLVAVLYKPRPRRHATHTWTSDWRLRPRYKDWDSALKDKLTSLRFLDIDENLTGRLWEQVTYYYPADSSVIRAIRYAAGPRSEVVARTTSVLKDEMTLSLRGQELQVLFQEQVKLLCEVGETGASFTVLTPSGLTLKVLSDGSILQSTPRSDSSATDEEEENRILTGFGTVVCCLKANRKRVLFANGNVSSKGPDNIWVRTNNKGLRRGFRVADSFECELDALPCASVTDSKTFTKTVTREDMVMIIRYSDGTQVTQHRDGTKMHVASDGGTVLVEKEGYAPVKVRRTGKQNNVLTYLDAHKGSQDLLERSYDGLIMEVFLPDGSRLATFNQAEQTSEYGEVKISRVHLLQLHTGACLKLQQDGEVALISSLQAAKMSREQIFTELFGPEDSRSAGVCTASLRTSNLRLIDSEGHRFHISGSGEVEAKLAEPAEEDLQLPDPVDYDGKYAVGCPRTEYPARLFVVRNTGEGVELLTESQIAQFKLTKAHTGAIYLKDVGEICTTHAWLTPIAVSRLEQGHLPDSPLLRFAVPEVVHNIHHVQYPASLSLPTSALFRCLLEYPAMTTERRSLYLADLTKFSNWKASRETVLKELGVMDQRNESQKREDFKVQVEILRLRKNKVGTEVRTAAELKGSMLEKLVQLKEFESVFVPAPPERMVSLHAAALDQTDLKCIYPGQKKDHEAGQADTRSKRGLVQKPSFNAASNRSFFNYFDSPEGHIFLMENPPKARTEPGSGMVPPLDDVGADSLKNEEEKKSYEAMRDTLSQKMSTSTQQLPQEEKDDPLVVLQPEELPKSKQKYPAQPVILKPVTGPSCFAETEILLKQREEQKTMEADEYRDKKTKKYDVFGLPRSTKPTVQSIRTSSPVKELNEKHVLVESATERRVKISSMAARIHMQAPSVQSMRREGVHTTIGRAIAKKMTVEEVESQQNAMINSKLQDPLTRSLSISPENLRFGVLKEGGVYTMTCKVQNMGDQLARFRIRQPDHDMVRILYQPTPLAPGVSQMLQVQITGLRVDALETQFHVVDNTFIYILKVFARVVSESNFEELERENQRTKGKSVLSPLVKWVNSGEAEGREQESSDSELNFQETGKMKT